AGGADTLAGGSSESSICGRTAVPSLAAGDAPAGRGGAVGARVRGGGALGVTGRNGVTRAAAGGGVLGSAVGRAGVSAGAGGGGVGATARGGRGTAGAGSAARNRGVWGRELEGGGGRRPRGLDLCGRGGRWPIDSCRWRPLHLRRQPRRQQA